MALTAFALLTANNTMDALVIVARSSVIAFTKSPSSLTATGVRFVVVVVACRNPVFAISAKDINLDHPVQDLSIQDLSSRFVSSI